MPLIIPADTQEHELAELLSRCDGLLFTGSPSNVNPALYGKSLHPSQPSQDTMRDDWTLPLLRAAVAHHVPLLAICRGFQEMNVALGGSLHQRLVDVENYDNHHPFDTGDLDGQYAPAHSVSLTAGGLLQRTLGVAQMQVNSLHNQGIDRVAESLEIEARAADGVIEALSVRGSKIFQLGVQWHPEWRAVNDLHSLTIFRTFAQACQENSAKKSQGQDDFR